jgi:hypothetical protein
MKLFISYRRKANVQRAMILAALLRDNFGKSNVFLDTSDIDIGDSFPEELSNELDISDAVVTLISPEWLSSLDDNFRRRIDLPGDWVNRELAMALQKGKLIVPVYVGGAKKLRQEQLPTPLIPLANLQGYELRDDHQWNDDVIALISRLKGREIPSEEIRWPKATLKYKPDPIGPVKIQDMMAGLPDWNLVEFEIDSGPFKGQRGSEITRSYQFKTSLMLSNLCREQHHP